MEKTNYTKLIQKASTLEELNTIKNSFLSECAEREKRISVGNLLGQIKNFTDAAYVFESIAPALLSKRGGKGLVKTYTTVIKENDSLKTLYLYQEGLKENKTPDSKKTYIVEALGIGKRIKEIDYINGVTNIVRLISEAFRLLGDDYVLNNVKHNNDIQLLGESLYYLSSTKKTVNNLNDYMNHINIVSENHVLCENNDIDVDKTLDEIVSDLNKPMNESEISSIFETEDKESTFNNTKKICLEMLQQQISFNQDKDITIKLTEMANKLTTKTYQYETFTNDMLYMTELKELLK